MILESPAVARLVCGDEQGSAFFIAPNVAVTAKHCVMQYLENRAPIQLTFPNGKTILASIGEPEIPEPEDVVFLLTEEEVEDSLVVRAVTTHLPTGIEWKCSGFPSALEGHPSEFSGVIGKTQLVDNSPWDIELLPNGQFLSDYSGLSGSPILTAQGAVGVVLRQVQKTLVGASLIKLRRFLQLANISFDSADTSASIPLWFQPVLRNFVSNSRAAWALEEAIREIGSGIVILEGLPGAGKSSLAATFQSSDDSIKVLGRYFLSGDPAYPPQHYRNPRVFNEWLCAQAAFYSPAAAASKPGCSINDLVVANFVALSTHCSERSEIGVLIIDGIEEVNSADGQPTITDLIPRQLPSNIVIVLTSSRPDLGDIFSTNEIPYVVAKIPGLLQYECEMVADKINPDLTHSQVVSLVRESAGHPLLFTLLLLEVKDASGEDGVQNLNGIEGYYSRVYSRLKGEGQSVWLLATLARTRQPISETDLVQILPIEQRHLFEESFGRLRHLLLIDNEGVKLYHQSLSDFLQSKTHNIDRSIHQALASFCCSNSKSDYARTNIIHHHIRASQFEQALSLADQSTFDAAGFIFAPPELMLGDVDELIAYTLGEGNFARLLELLLLRSRIKFRYDTLFTDSALELAELAARVGKPERALSFVIRQNASMCEPYQCISLVRSLFCAGKIEAAGQFFRFIRPGLWLEYENELGIPESVMAAHFEMASLLASLSEDFALDKQRLLGFFREFPEDSMKHQQTLSRIMGRCHGQIIWALGGHPVPEVWRRGAKQNFATDCLLALSFSGQLFREHGPADASIDRTPASPALSSPPALAQLVLESFKDYPPGKISIPAAVTLLEHSATLDWIELVKVKFPSQWRLTIRGKNGVDPDRDSLEFAFLAGQLCGYSSGKFTNGEFPRDSRHPWEIRFLEAMRKLGKLSGEHYRDRSLGLELNACFERLVSEVLDDFCFRLPERIRWEDSSFLPELCSPAVYGRCAEFIAQFDPTRADDLIDYLTDKTGDQLGLYSEGYVEALACMAEELAVSSISRSAALRLWTEAFSFIKGCVFSRKERVSGLIRCANYAARLKDRVLTKAAFTEALDASLGPDWYKEGQFSLLIDSLTAKPLATRESDWKKAVELLELASGECTFQRYVRYDKVRLIQKLASAHAWAEAVGLARHYLLPAPAVQKCRLDRTPNDRVSPWATGRFGVAEVEEQAVLVEMLECAPSEAEHIRWALLELALPLEDRHLERLGVQANKLLSGSHAETFAHRFLRTLRMDVAPDRRQHLCAKLLDKCDTNSALHQAIQRAVEADILSQPEEKARTKPEEQSQGVQDEFTLPGTFGKTSSYEGLKVANDKASKLLSRKQYGPAREVLIKGLIGCQEGGWPIWEAGGAAQAALSLLFSSGNLEECTRELRPLVSNQMHSFDWKVVSTLLECVLPHADAAELASIARSLQDHLNLIVGPEKKHIPVPEKELEIELPPSQEPTVCLGHFLVSLLDHPDEYFRARTGEIIRWLVQSGELTLDVLTSRLEGHIGVDHGREAVGGVLRGLDGKVIAESSDGQSPAVASEGFGLPLAQPAQPLSKSNVRAPYTWSLGLPKEIKEEPKLLAEAEEHLRELCLPFSPKEAREIYKLRHSAFSVVSSSVEGTAQEREAIRRTICGRPADTQKRFVESFAAFNPLWPTDLLDYKISEGFIKATWDNLNQRRPRPFDLPLGTLLHAMEIQTGERGYDDAVRELTSFFVEPGKLRLPTRERLTDYLSLHFPTPPTSSDKKVSTVKRYPQGNNLGGVITPAKPSDRFMNSGPYNPELVHRVFWQNGRVQAPYLGAPLFQGGATFYRFPRSPEFELGWLISRDGEPLLYCFPDRQRIIRPGDRL